MIRATLKHKSTTGPAGSKQEAGALCRTFLTFSTCKSLPFKMDRSGSVDCAVGGLILPGGATCFPLAQAWGASVMMRIGNIFLVLYRKGTQVLYAFFPLFVKYKSMLEE